MSRKQKRMGPVGCFGQIENIKRQSLNSRNLSVNYVVGFFYRDDSDFHRGYFQISPWILFQVSQYIFGSQSYLKDREADRGEDSFIRQPTQLL